MGKRRHMQPQRLGRAPTRPMSGLPKLSKVFFPFDTMGFWYLKDQLGSTAGMARAAGGRPSLPGAATNADGGADADEGENGARDVALAIKTLTLKDTCAYCGKKGADKRCSICKLVWYCGADCQKVGWKGHKKTCAPPLPPAECERAVTAMRDAYLNDVMKKVKAATTLDDWRGVVKWDWRMEELLEGQPDEGQLTILSAFAWAHESGRISTDSNKHSLSGIEIQKRRVEILGKMERFRDQGEALCAIADKLLCIGKLQEGKTYFQRVRDLGAKHGFFSAECEACAGTLNPKPLTLNPQPSTLNPQPSIRNPQPSTLNPKP